MWDLVVVMYNLNHEKCWEETLRQMTDRDIGRRSCEGVPCTAWHGIA